MPQPLLTPTQIAAKAPPRNAKPLTLTPREKNLIHALVWDGLKRPEAARAAGLSDNGAYKALRQPHVKAALLHEYEVLRTSARPRAFTKLTELVDGAKSERVQLEAAKYVDSAGTSERDRGVTVNVGVNIQPGYLIDTTAYADDAKRILKEARSTHSLLDGDAE